jgi:hypothetical protein
MIISVEEEIARNEQPQELLSLQLFENLLHILSSINRKHSKVFD